MIKDVKIKSGCISCGTCERICPNVFKVDGISTVITRDFSVDQSLIFEASESCPVNVIDVIADDFSSEIVFRTAYFVDMKPLCSNVWNLFVKVGNEFEFVPGQYVVFKMHDENGEFTRAYSIVGLKDGILEFCIKFSSKNSRGQKFFNDLDRNHIIEISDAKGYFLMKQNNNPKVFIATGTGVAPFVAMLENLSGNENFEKTLMLGVGTEDEIFYLERLKKIPNLKLIYTLSRALDEWEGHKGRVTAHFEGLPLTKETEIYICGNPAMVADSKKYFLEMGHGVENIFVEEFSSQDVVSKKKNFIEKILFDGEIPFLKWIRILVYVMAFLSPFLLTGVRHNEFASYGWTMLFGVMLIRPLADFLPDFGILRTLVSMRREFGIFSGILILNHFFGYLVQSDLPIFSSFKEGWLWDYRGVCFWGLIGIIASIPALLSSNNFSMRIFKSHWKTLQKLSYVFFIFGAIHVYLVGEEDALVYGITVAVFWMLSLFKVKIKIPEKIKNLI